MIILLILIWPLVTLVVLLELNARSMLPGTKNYRLDQLEREAEMNTARARQAAIESRYREHEDEHITRQLEAAR